MRHLAKDPNCVDKLKTIFENDECAQKINISICPDTVINARFRVKCWR
jgi:tartrate dehydratase alpha subunit/fumarate hydratase class I-like protein